MNRRLVALASLFAGLMSAQEIQFPADPERPTIDDCTALSGQYAAIVHDLYLQLFMCYKEGTKFGWAQGCGKQVYTAYVNCARFDVSMCEVNQRRTEAVNACRSRAEARAQQENRERQQAEEEKVLAARLKKTNDTIEAARSAASAISDPKTYFVKALGANSPVLKEFFKSDDYRSDSVRTDVASEVYRMAQTYTETGIENTTNPIVRRIQQEALKRLLEEHKDILRQANNLSVSLKEFSVDAPSARPAVILSDNSCALLKDEDASRKLMQEDSRRWLELSSRCSK